MNMKKNKRGWVEIVEAAISILLITVALLVVINKGYIGKSDISEGVYKTEVSILREIETNYTLREQILNVPLISLPVKKGDVEFPAGVSDLITKRTPAYLNCTEKLCNLCDGGICEVGESTLPCDLDINIEKDVYSQSVIISSIPAILGDELIGDPNPTVMYRRLNLFCWQK
jgi:hypothetical protein